jgi:UDP:flavonoid glycosyltransferase YjiC (YdhE family)
LRKAIARVLSDRTYTEKARAMKASIQQAGGVAKAADLIEGLGG